MSALKFYGRTIAGTTATIMGRVRNAGGDITAAGISTIKLRVVDRNDPNTLIESERDIAPDDVIDDLSTDFPWSINTVGYTFRYEVLPVQIPTGEKAYIFQFKFTPVSGQVFIQECVVSTDESLYLIS